MATNLSIALNDAPFKLVPTLATTDYTTVQLTNKVVLGAAADHITEKRQAEVIKLNQLDKELIACVILEFKDAWTQPRLHLDIAKRFTKFRDILDEPFRSEWDSCRDNEPITQVGFNNAMTAFLERYFEPTDMLDQRQYLGQARKPYKLDCTSLASRLRKINKMMMLFEDDDEVPFDDDDLKE